MPHFTKELNMAEKCLMVTTLAVLVFHPSSTIRCFRPNSNSTSPQGNNHRLNPKVWDPVEEKESSKSRKKLDFPSSYSLSRTCSSPLSLSTTMKGRALSNIFTELVAGEQLVCVVEAIFRSGWTCKDSPAIEKILKVNHDEEVLDRFEAYRKRLKSKARKTTKSNRMERAVVDGNELLQFHSTSVTCSLGSNGMLNICNKKSCGVCKMISSSVLAKVKPVSFFETSWAAHENITRETGVSGGSGSGTKAMVVCRVIAGRVANYCVRENKNREELEFESVIVTTGDQSSGTEELIVLNPRAILPCFVVLYSVRGLSYEV